MSMNQNNLGELFLNSFLTPYLNRQHMRSNSVSSPFGSTTPAGIPVDMINEEKTITIYAEIPGVDKNNIEVDFFNNKLTIMAEKVKPYENNTDNAEIVYGKFERQVSLPICVTRKETVSVSHKNGILKVVINKLVEEENRFSMRISE